MVLSVCYLVTKLVSVFLVSVRGKESSCLYSKQDLVKFLTSKEKKSEKRKQKKLSLSPKKDEKSSNWQISKLKELFKHLNNCS